MDNAKLHTFKWNLPRMQELHLKRTAYTSFNLDIASSNFFLFGWLKGQLASRPVAEIDELFEVVRRLLQSIQLQMLLRTRRRVETSYCF
jgi:hypothetical protein